MQRSLSNKLGFPHLLGRLLIKKKYPFQIFCSTYKNYLHFFDKLESLLEKPLGNTAMECLGNLGIEYLKNEL
jgi:hypothetical protein